MRTYGLEELQSPNSTAREKYEHVMNELTEMLQFDSPNLKRHRNFLITVANKRHRI